MSTSSPSIQRESVAEEFPSDPLLDSGAFISSTTTAPAGDGALESSAKRRGSRVVGSGVSLTKEMSSSTNPTNPSPDNSATPVESKSRKRVPPGDSWLPPGWRIEDKVRTSGVTAGSVDKYYFEPITGRRFRSKTEVLYYMEHGTAKKSNKRETEGQGSTKATKKGKEPPPPPLEFDFDNVPESVTWSNGAGDEAWSAFFGDEKVQDSVVQEWNKAFEVITTLNPSKISKP